MSIEKLLDHFEKDADTLKEHITKIRNRLSMVNPNKDDRKEIENSLFELFRVTHCIDSICIQVTQKAHTILGYDSADDNEDDVEHLNTKK